MKVTLLLADSAQIAEDKLYILGGGWTTTGPAPSSMAIAALIEVPWDQTNREHRWALTLVDADGHSVELATGDGTTTPVVAEGGFEVGRPPGSAPGMSFTVPLAINFSGLPLPGGERLLWSLSVDGESRDGWQVAFNTRT